MQKNLSLEHITFSYGDYEVIKDFSLEVEAGSFTTLLGTSGCGKTTLLRLIAGFLEPKSGYIKIDGQIQNKILPNKRQIGMVFQDYALFPHMTVEQNLLYGLRFNKFSKTSKLEKQNIVLSTAKKLGLSDLLRRYPGQLSGGQQQRVALGRVLVLNPSLLLMDEPLSSLDTSLRQVLRDELKQIQQELKITMLYVTHDQEEAMSLSDKIAIMEDGRLLQQGTPKELYFNQQYKKGSSFFGKSNLLKIDGKNYFVRTEWIKLSSKFDEQHGFTNKAELLKVSFLGQITRCELKWQEQTFNVDVFSEPDMDLQVGQTVYFKITHKIM